ncbi:MAG: hydroxyisourate hydrolase [Bacteroidetes bacterium]|nr:MAG: hydroxyisourate hydrolase [Bacteroidota bacterium]REK04730.1 MAG: hydroxyisourate hydrolase [Bacteroidota bacterium]REK36204.1 MAG: hydroxyisourate hydrolase [Bacteroidota bacterium]REK51425.1 MAG: hydroxyisourate hydrolase [Bacteroidota bacterium]
MSQITTHILDTSVGKPAEGVNTYLEKLNLQNSFEFVAKGITNKDGRISDLVSNKTLESGIYRLRFETGDYYKSKNIKTFYPYIEITFEISGTEHYHVPLLLNPFGYSTYRGS